MAAFNKSQAEAAANNLVNRLGDGYEPVIFENLGWHYHAKKGSIHVYEQIVRNPEQKGFPAYYEATIVPDEAVSFSGNSMSFGVRISSEGNTPQEAVKNVKQQCRSDCARLESLIQTLMGIE